MGGGVDRWCRAGTLAPLIVAEFGVARLRAHLELYAGVLKIHQSRRGLQRFVRFGQNTRAGVDDVTLFGLKQVREPMGLQLEAGLRGLEAGFAVGRFAPVFEVTQVGLQHQDVGRVHRAGAMSTDAAGELDQ